MKKLNLAAVTVIAVGALAGPAVGAPPHPTGTWIRVASVEVKDFTGSALISDGKGIYDRNSSTHVFDRADNTQDANGDGLIDSDSFNFYVYGARTLSLSGNGTTYACEGPFDAARFFSSSNPDWWNDLASSGTGTTSLGDANLSCFTGRGQNHQRVLISYPNDDSNVAGEEECVTVTKTGAKSLTFSAPGYSPGLPGVSTVQTASGCPATITTQRWHGGSYVTTSETTNISAPFELNAALE